jgi:catechol 2,3-dioxygenase-like lactoylglutathione lyase family enzyme
MSAALRLELFVKDLAVSREFYTRVLGFEAGDSHADGYTPMQRGTATVSLNLRSVLPEGHPSYVTAQDGVGGGIEIVLEEDDLMARYAHVKAQGWPLASDLTQQVWGLMDFRIVDPDGYYWRITSGSEGD